jgi:hypothetical protein
MANSILETSNPETQDGQENNAIFESDSSALEDMLLQKREVAETEEVEEETQEEEAETEEQEESTEQETEEEESEEEESESEEDDDEPKLDDKFQKAFDKRITREIKKLNKEHEERMAELNEKIKEKETPADAVSQVKQTRDLKKLDKLEEDAESVLDAIDELDIEYDSEHDAHGAVLSGKFYTKQEILAFKRNARSTMKEVSKRRKFVSEVNAIEAETHKAYPALEDKGSELSLAVSGVFNQIPGLQEHPHGKLAAIYMLLGEQTANQQTQAPKKKKAAPKAPVVPSSKPAPKKAKASAKPKIDIEAIAQFGGDQESLENALASRL